MIKIERYQSLFATVADMFPFKTKDQYNAVCVRLAELQDELMFRQSQKDALSIWEVGYMDCKTKRLVGSESLDKKIPYPSASFGHSMID